MEADELARENNMIFYECSAKTGFNIDKLFTLSATDILNKITNKEINLGDQVKYIKYFFFKKILKEFFLIFF